MKVRRRKYYLELALTAARASYAQRDQVGCVLVKNDRVIATGFNGTVPGEPNICEGEDGETLASVLHAEANAVLSVAASNESTRNAIAFVTRAPCLQCAMILIAARIAEVHYIQKGSGEGLDLLKNHALVVPYDQSPTGALLDVK